MSLYISDFFANPTLPSKKILIQGLRAEIKSIENHLSNIKTWRNSVFSHVVVGRYTPELKTEDDIRHEVYWATKEIGLIEERLAILESENIEVEMECKIEY